MEVINEFIAVYNDYLSAKMNNFSDVELIEPKENRTGINREINSVQYFLTAFKFPSMYQYSGFCFVGNRQAQLPDGFIHFATHIDYNLLYVYSLDDGKVYLWDEGYGRIEWCCAESIEIFFKSMIAVMKTKIEMIRSGNFNLPQSYLKSVFKYCLDLNENKDQYIEFYDHILGIE